MKSRPNRFQVAAAAFTVGVFLIPAKGADSATSAAADQPLIAAAESRSRGERAHDVIGREVNDRAGANLGQIADLLVDPVDGKILFAIVGSGGVLGVGEDLRPVPFQALRRSGDDFALQLDRSRWNDAPKLREDQFAALNSHPMGRSIFEFYGQETDGELKQLSSRPRQSHLMRVADLTGKSVTSGGDEVGEVEDVIVHIGSRRASVLLDPNDNYTGTDAKFIVHFNQLTPTPDRDDLTTSLTRAEFERAAPAEENWWAMTDGYPYTWGAPYTPAAGAGYAIRSFTNEKTERERDGDIELDGRPSVTVVRGALRSNAALSEAARRATIERMENRLVIAGTVESEAMKQRVEETVTEAAEGWTIENRLTVLSAAE